MEHEPYEATGRQNEFMIAQESFEKDGEYAFRSIAGEGVLVPIKHGVGDLESIFTFNEVGTVIWGLIDGVRSASEIAEIVSRTFDVLPREALEDVEGFLAALRKEGLVRPVTLRGT